MLLFLKSEFTIKKLSIIYLSKNISYSLKNFFNYLIDAAIFTFFILQKNTIPT